MKPYLMKFACPHCKMGLQSEHTESGKSLSCPGCKQAFIAPPAPPRPFGGWLAVIGVLLLLGFAYGVVLCIFSIILIPLLVPMIWGLYGFVKQRKWFITFSIVSYSFGIVLGLIFSPAQAFLFLGVVVYFWRSQRVKETFTT
jgi:uncharacterized paraquat-inducible protein A